MKKIVFIFAFILSFLQLTAQNVTVTNLNDTGAGSLRNAIIAVGVNGVIDFGALSGTINLTSDHLVINKSNFTILGNGNITINGSTLAPLSTATLSKHVFYINSGSNITIDNLTITGAPLPIGYTCGDQFPLGTGGGIGVYLRPNVTNVIIRNSYVHSNSSHGIFLEQNNTGVQIVNNTVSNNCNNGIQVDNGSTGVIIRGNRVGTNQAGTAAFGNYWDGIVIDNRSHNFMIGGTTVADRNIVSGNGRNVASLPQATDRGIRIGNSRNGTIQGNFVGLNAAGTASIGNARHGIFLHSVFDLAFPTNGAQNNTIIGNVISGNGTLPTGEGHGINIADERTTGNIVRSNLIGTDATGMIDLGNKNDGVSIFWSSNNTIGGPATLDGNLISGNNFGIFLQASADNNTVQNNRIGLNLTGTAAIPNSESGILIQGGYYSWINWGPSPDRPSLNNQVLNNIVSGNTLHGIVIQNGTFPDGPSVSPTTGNIVRGNYVGVLADGITALPNGSNGVMIADRASGNTIGGTTAAHRNIISGNTENGVQLTGGAFSNSVLGNFIGLDINQAARPNGLDGILIQESNGNFIGNATAGSGNVIGSNTNNGIQILNSDNNILLRNTIGTTLAGNVARTNGSAGIYISESGALTSTGNVIGDATNTAYANIIAYNPNGILIQDGARLNPIRKNSIYCNSIKGIELVAVGPTGGNDYYATPMTPPIFNAARTILSGTGAGANGIVEIFSHDATCMDCQGKTFVAQVTANAFGAWSYTFGSAVPLAQANSYVVTATQAGAAPQNTSEFSACSSLPVSIINLIVLEGEGIHTLQWSYVTEDQVLSFEILGSDDGFQYNRLGSVSAFEGSGIQQASFNVSNTASYYQIRAYYANGKTSIHGPITPSGTSTPWVVYPNPVSDVLTVMVTEPATVQWFSISGQLLAETPVVKGKNNLSVSTIDSGWYTVKIVSATQVTTYKIMVLK
ncbi:MAG: right-handed parallel beta-helix repeat-containing protein [Cytophagaceae bacterium]|jgi:parallel beta-helix repeat protein|nr:right-handed parallel beta-helix repeat-containing protein [Cytophagaceae bacterium]